MNLSSIFPLASYLRQYWGTSSFLRFSSFEIKVISMTPNQKAFLTMLSVSEGTSTSPATVNNGYDVIVTGVDGEPEVFTDYSTHPFANGRPPKQINDAGLVSSASGRYQFLVKYWLAYKASLSLPDFSPASQDKWALQLIRECNALTDIELGDLETAIRKCSSRWASLPGSMYKQHTNHYDKLQTAFLAAGGSLSTTT